MKGNRHPIYLHGKQHTLREVSADTGYHLEGTGEHVGENQAGPNALSHCSVYLSSLRGFVGACFSVTECQYTAEVDVGLYAKCSMVTANKSRYYKHSFMKYK